MRSRIVAMLLYHVRWINLVRSMYRYCGMWCHCQNTQAPPMHQCMTCITNVWIGASQCGSMTICVCRCVVDVIDGCLVSYSRIYDMSSFKCRQSRSVLFAVAFVSVWSMYAVPIVHCHFLGASDMHDRCMQCPPMHRVGTMFIIVDCVVLVYDVHLSWLIDAAIMCKDFRAWMIV